MKLLKIFSLVFVALIASTIATEVRGIEPDDRFPVPGIQVKVPWKEDTTYVDCVSEIPPIVEPTASSSCRLMNKPQRSIQTYFGSCLNDRIIVRTWSFSDVCGNKAQVSQVIIVLDKIPPEVVVPWAEDTLWLECTSDIPPLIYPEVSDNCEMKDTTRAIETRFGACTNERTIKRTWIFRDMCDNETRATQVIVVEDRTPPEITFCPSENFVREIGSRSSYYRVARKEFDMKASDYCGGDIQYSYSLSGATEMSGLETLHDVAFNPGETGVTWMAMDACGNVSVCGFLVTVKYPPPVFDDAGMPYHGLHVYPNPFSEILIFEFGSPVDAEGYIDLYNLTGKRVKRLFKGQISAGQNYQVSFVPTNETSGIYYYYMKLGEKIFRGKVMYNR